MRRAMFNIGLSHRATETMALHFTLAVWLFVMASPGAFCADVTSAKKLVFMPFPVVGSQYFNVLTMAEEMFRRGHQVTVLTSPLLKKRKSEVKQIDCNVPAGINFIEQLNAISSQQQIGGISDYLAIVGDVLSLESQTCLDILRNEQTRKVMDEADMIVMVSPRACGVYAAAILEKPFIVLHPAPLPAIGSFAQVPLPPSYVAMNGRQSSDEMSFLERTSNFLSFQIKDIVVDWLVTYYYREIQAKFDWETNESFVKLFGKAELYIVSVDFAFEFAHPLMPNVFYVGPILPKPPAILPPDLETFMQSSRDNGVVVISFGSAINSLSRTIIDRMLLAISQLKQKVVWKIKLAADAQIPPNLKVVDWLPQNDLIGHAKTKAFVSHMGANGAAEAAYHGVPLVAACIMSDSFYNTVRFVKKVKMAKLIDVYNADADTWKNTIEEVINNSSYKDNAMKASKLIRSWPKSSLEQAGDLIQYALDNGGRLPHLKSNAHKLYWFQYHCVDVVAFLLFVFIATLFILYKTFKLLLYLLLGYKSKSKTE